MRPNPVSKDASPLERHVAAALKEAGWSLRPADPPADFLAVKGPRRYPILVRRAQDARRSGIQALLADAILRGRASVKGGFVAVVSAPAISPAMARSIEQYVAEVAPGQPFGYADDRGLVSFSGLGLERARAEGGKRPHSRSAAERPRDLFSDLNQWLLKILVGRNLPPEMIAVPRQPVRSAAELAARGGASAPAAWRLYSALKNAGYLDDAGSPALVRDLFARWRAAAQRPQQRVGARWICRGALPSMSSAARSPSFDARKSNPRPASGCSRPATPSASATSAERRSISTCGTSKPTFSNDWASPSSRTASTRTSFCASHAGQSRCSGRPWTLTAFRSQT